MKKKELIEANKELFEKVMSDIPETERKRVTRELNLADFLGDRTFSNKRELIEEFENFLKDAPEDTPLDVAYDLSFRSYGCYECGGEDFEGYVEVRYVEEVDEPISKTRRKNQAFKKMKKKLGLEK